ncbi:MAG: hypothetical protein AAGF28_09090 [Pseudomonadota bacterium]
MKSKTNPRLIALAIGQNTPIAIYSSAETIENGCAVDGTRFLNRVYNSSLADR